MPTIANHINHGHWKNIWVRLYPAVFSLLLSLLISGLLLLVSGRDPITAYKSLLYGAFGTGNRFTETLIRMTPFLILTISVSISFRCGVWNIGAKGQLILGAIASIWVALTFKSLPILILMPLTFMAAIIGGAIWSGRRCIKGIF